MWAIGIDPAYVAVPMLSVFAAAIGGSRRIKIKNDWCEPSIIWTVTIGSVSAGKSPGFDAARKPMIEIEKKLEQLRRKRKTEYDQEQKLYEAAKNSGGKGIANPKLLPYHGQDLINDCTMEALSLGTRSIYRSLSPARQNIMRTGRFGSYRCFRKSSESYASCKRKTRSRNMSFRNCGPIPT